MAQQSVSAEGTAAATTPTPLDYALSARPDGASDAPKPAKRSLHRGYLLAFFWLIVPILVMSIPRDKQDRYLLPMLAPAAVITARGLLAFAAGVRRGRTDAGIWLAIPLGIIAAVAVAVPVLGRLPGLLIRKIDGGPWFDLLPAAIALVLAILLGITMFRFAARRRPVWAIAIAGFMVVAVAAFGIWGYRDSVGGRDEMKPIAERIRTQRPTATVGYYDPRKDSKPLPPDLGIYMNQAIPTLKRGTPEKPGPQTEGPMPDVIVVLQREDEKAPTVPGWRTIATEPYRKRFWHAMVRSE